MVLQRRKRGFASEFHCKVLRSFPSCTIQKSWRNESHNRCISFYRKVCGYRCLPSYDYFNKNKFYSLNNFCNLPPNYKSMKYRNKQEQVNHELEQFLTTLRSLIDRK